MIRMGKQFISTMALVLFCFLLPEIALSEQIIFEEDFESGWGDYWGADNGLWEIGIPTAGPENAYEGTNCAGTVLDGNYSGNTDSKLISPTFHLPQVEASQEIHFRFMNWFSYASSDAGYVQISVFNNDTNEWSDWENLIADIDNNSSSWSMIDIELTKYSLRSIRIGFYHTAYHPQGLGGIDESTGWYIDNIKILLKNPNYTELSENFESGWSSYWSSDNGLWEIGVPTAGPETAYEGTNCAGTVLDDNYSGNTDSRLISPTLNLPKIDLSEEIHFRFMNWFSYASSDAGYVQISVFNNDTNDWSDWKNLIADIRDNSVSWSMMDVDITKYACEKIKIGFYHTAYHPQGLGGMDESTGWYIDDVRLVFPKRFQETPSETSEPDFFEPDDTRAQANIADLSSETEQIHSFHQAGDQDWIKLYGNQNQVYTFDITDTGSRTNLVFNIYDGKTDYLLKRFYVPAECEKSISWTCPAEGTYYITTAQTNPNIYGEGTQYTLRIYPSFTVDPLTLELNEGSTDTITIRGGKGPYDINSSATAIATGHIFTQAGVFVQVKGLSPGMATLSISDSSSGAEPQEVTVTVNEVAQPTPRAKAIIVAGGGPYQGNTLWNTTRALANSVYITLVYQGFGKESIQYLSPDMNVDLDGNGLYDEVDDLATGESLQNAITEWALDADELVLFITDHGGSGTFQINETELLQATDLDQWLDELQQTLPGKVTVVYDACHSGSFLSALTPPQDKERIVLSSTDVGQEAYFTSFGDLSFTSFFWQHVINGMSVYDAFFTAKNAIEYTYGRQTPQMDDNGNGIGNEDAEGETAKETYIGKGLISGGGLPVIDGVPSDITLQEDETSTIIYADTVIDSDGIERVWAVITRPDHAPASPDAPVLEMPMVELRHVGNNRYQGIYTEFDVAGNYSITIYAKDSLGSVAVPAHTTVIKAILEETAATYDPSGLIAIPCADILGATYSMNLFVTGISPLTFQMMPDMALAENCIPCAQFKAETGILHINNFDLGISYWVDLILSGTDSIAFSLVNSGENE